MKTIDHLWIRLQQIVPNPKGMCWENDYDRITWNDDRPLPTAIDIEAVDPTPFLPETIEAAKQQDIIDNLPSWAQVETAVDNIANLEEAKSFLKKLSRVVYWVAKNSKD